MISRYLSDTEIRLGDLVYEDDAVAVFHGDASEGLAAMAYSDKCPYGVDHVISDPPYDEHTHENARRSEGDGVGELAITFDHVADPGPLIAVATKAAARWVVLFSPLELLGDYKRGLHGFHVPGKNPGWVRGGVWVRTTNTPQFTGDRPAQAAEGIAIAHRPGRKEWNGGGSAGVWVGPRAPTAERVGRHPTPKPLWLMKRLVADFTKPGDLILDPFCGGGTTLRAAKDLGRRCIGIDNDLKWCKVTKDRMAQAVLPLPCPDEDGTTD